MVEEMEGGKKKVKRAFLHNRYKGRTQRPSLVKMTICITYPSPLVPRSPGGSFQLVKKRRITLNGTERVALFGQRSILS